MFGNRSRIKYTLGFHLEHEEFKVVGLAGSRKGYHLDFQSRFSPGPDGMPTPGQLQEIINCTGINQGVAVAALPGEHLVIRHFELPEMSFGDPERTVCWEMKMLASGEDRVVRAVRLGRQKKKDKNMVILLGVAVPYYVTKAFTELFLRAGIQLVAIEPQPIAVWRLMTGIALPSRENGDYSAVVYVGGKTSFLLVLRKGAIVYSRILPLGVHLSYATPSSVPGSSIDEELFGEISGTLSYFYRSGDGREVDQVHLCGENILLPPEEKAGVYGNLSFSLLKAELPGGDVLSPEYAVAAGLALRGWVE